MEQTALLRVWARIVSELALHQDSAPQEFAGQVVNPISGSVCAQDTACAAKVFAVEYNRTGDEKWLTRAKAALESLHDIHIYSGLPEPIWDVFDWHEDSGSLFITGTALDAVWETVSLLGMSPQKDDLQHLFGYLAGCLHGPGRFAHNAVKPGTSSILDVQNTTAIALYLLEYAVHKFPLSDHPILKERDQALRHLLQGQRRDGYWPYACPSWSKQVGFRFPILTRIRGVRRFFTGFGDNSINVGDAMHHCLVLYYLMKSTSLQGVRFAREGIARGWDWISRYLLPEQNGSLCFDWSWEATPGGPRFCNFRDTNTYFLILASLPLLVRERIIGEESFQIGLGLVTHIETNLLEEGVFPSIKPHEGPIKIRRNILPCVEEGVAWKGALLAGLVLETVSLDVLSAAPALFAPCAPSM